MTGQARTLRGKAWGDNACAFRAELTALAAAVMFVSVPDGYYLRVITDCKSVATIAMDADSITMNGGEKQSNPDLARAVAQAITAPSHPSPEVSWVPGHVLCLGNRRADVAANTGRRNEPGVENITDALRARVDGFPAAGIRRCFRSGPPRSEELARAVQKGKNNKAPGVDGVRVEQLKRIVPPTGASRVLFLTEGGTNFIENLITAFRDSQTDFQPRETDTLTCDELAR